MVPHFLRCAGRKTEPADNKSTVKENTEVKKTKKIEQKHEGKTITPSHLRTGLRRARAELLTQQLSQSPTASTPDSRLPTPDSRLPTPDFRLSTFDFRPSTFDNRLSTSRASVFQLDSRLSPFDFRLSTFEFALPTCFATFDFPDFPAC